MKAYSQGSLYGNFSRFFSIHLEKIKMKISKNQSLFGLNMSFSNKNHSHVSIKASYA